MILSLQYRELSAASEHARKLGKELDQYCDQLSSKIQKSMHSVEGGMSSYLNSADYYVNKKIRKLREKEQNAYELSQKLERLGTTAVRVDCNVKSMIEANQRSFFNKNPDMKAPSMIQRAFTSFICDIKDIPVLGDIIRGGEAFLDALEELKRTTCYWWECGGGKELITNCVDIVVKLGAAALAVVGAVIAVVALATATVMTAGLVLTAVASFIAALIAVVNAGTNIATSAQAIAAGTRDPAMSRIYSKRDTMAQVLREENFHNKTLNRASNITASAIEITEAAAQVVLLVQSIGKIAGSFLSKNGVGFAFKELVHKSDGTLGKKVTLKSLWKGTKALVLNEKLTTSTSQGLRTTLITNIKQAVNYQCSLFKLAMRDSKGWIQKKQIGEQGFLVNTLEKLKYDMWQFKNSAFQFRNGDILFNLKKAETLVKFGNSGLGAIQNSLNNIGSSRKFVDGQVEKWVKRTLFSNNFMTVLDKSGIGSAISKWDQSGTIEKYTGLKPNGILQKVDTVKKNTARIWMNTQEQFPHYQYIQTLGG